MRSSFYEIVILFCLIIQLFLICNTATGQNTISDSSKCFFDCRIPYQYKYDTIKVIDKQQHKTTVKVPGSFLVMQDTVAYVSGDSMKKQIPAVYDMYEEQVLVSNKKESPRYKAVIKYIVLEEARTENLTNIPKLKPVTVYEQVSKNKILKIEVPATYTHVITKTAIKQKEQFAETEIVCPDKVTSQLIRQVQEHLKMLGYPVDGSAKELGEITIESLEKYQQENQLPIGKLNIPTLLSLNVVW